MYFIATEERMRDPFFIYRPTSRIGFDTVKETPKVEEPKNIAVKLLVDKLKTEQSALASAESNIKSTKATLKIYADAKSKNLKQIKELSDALKKLGHKETK